MTLLDPAFLLLGQLSEHIPQVPSQPCIQRLPSTLGTPTWSGLNFHSHPSMGLLFVCLAAHDSESRRWPRGVHSLICQTFAAFPAQPGGLLFWFSCPN